MTITRALTVSSILALALAGCVAGEPLDDLGTNRDPMTYEEFLGMVYQEPDTGVFVANGDELFETEEQLRELYEALTSQGALIVNRVGGADDRWYDPAQHALTYCVSTGFGSNYSSVVSAMASATGAWEAAADVNFVHESAYDSNCTSRTATVFNVRPVNSGCQYYARAFFPSTSRSGREILIDSCSFRSNNPSVTGILRHELGHTIGFRHEHTRPESGACFEDNNWRALTPYDQASVMHYPQCNGINSWGLSLTSYDKSGAATLYGAPGGGGGGGTDPGVCLVAGQSCSAAADCCSGVCATKGKRSRCQ